MIYFVLNSFSDSKSHKSFYSLSTKLGFMTHHPDVLNDGCKVSNSDNTEKNIDKLVNRSAELICDRQLQPNQ